MFKIIAEDMIVLDISLLVRSLVGKHHRNPLSILLRIKTTNQIFVLSSAILIIVY